MVFMVLLFFIIILVFMIGLLEEFFILFVIFCWVKVVNEKFNRVSNKNKCFILFKFKVIYIFIVGMNEEDVFFFS